MALAIERISARRRIRARVHVSSARYPTFHAIPHKILCNLSRLFPLYGVEAGGLPAKAAQRNELNVDKENEHQQHYMY